MKEVLSKCIVFEDDIMYWCRFAKEVCDAIVAKCLTGRPKTVEKAQMVFMLWVELEAVDAFLVCLCRKVKNLNLKFRLGAGGWPL